MLVAVGMPASSPAAIKIWPLMEIERDLPRDRVEARFLGPLVQFTAMPSETTLALRPFSLYRSTRVGTEQRQRLWILYPLLKVSREGNLSAISLLGGLASYQSLHTDRGEISEVKFRIPPLIFLDWRRSRGLGVSVLPFYARLENQLDFREIKIVMFPAYMSLTKDLWHRRYYLFPFFGTVSGPDAGGFRFWPLYGTKRLGDRHQSGFVAWPFYIWQREVREDGEEKRMILFPLLATVESSKLSSHAYGLSLFTHTLNHAAKRESFGFPWPLSAYEKDTVSGRPTTVRVFPFYQNKVTPGGTSRFVAWPLFRQKYHEVPGFSYRRTDFFLILSRWVEVENQRSSGGRRLRTLFPFYRDWTDGSVRSAGVPALADSLLPTNPVILDLYAPLWQLWSYTRIGDETEWSALWGAVARKRGRIRYPWQWW